MQDQLICNGCKRVLKYRRGDAGVCCPGCNTFTSVDTSGSVMSEMVCSRCPTLLVYNRGATNICCPHCSTVNSTRSGANQVCHLSCGQCRMILAYQLGASTVGCPGCRFVNHVRDARPQTVLVENPKTLRHAESTLHPLSRDSSVENWKYFKDKRRAIATGDSCFFSCEERYTLCLHFKKP